MAKVDNKPAPTLVAVVAQDPVQYDGVLQAVGQTFEVREADLVQLLELKAVALAA